MPLYRSNGSQIGQQAHQPYRMSIFSLMQQHAVLLDDQVDFLSVFIPVIMQWRFSSCILEVLFYL
jgi:hypothetical protein